MKPVASSEGVSIYCPDDGKIAFFNSPYPAHRYFSGVDVYPTGTFGDVAMSPVQGEVKEIRRVGCPKGRGFESSDSDYVLLLQSLENPERWIKVLHVKPLVKIGDVVGIGEHLGTLLRSGFFDFWTDPHIHVEVRDPSDPIRARGGFKFKRLIEVNEPAISKDMIGIVFESKLEYSLIALDEGISVDIEGQPGHLDAGIPHYRWMGIHVKGEPLSGSVRLCGRKIGKVRFIHSSMCVAECCNPIFKLNGKQVGLSLYLYLAPVPLLKIIPSRPGGLALKESEEVSLDIS